MDRVSLVNLTNNLYRLTLLFPKKEPLRYKIRELADDILADLTKEEVAGKLREAGFFLEKNRDQENRFAEASSGQMWLEDNLRWKNLIKNLEVLDSFFEVAKTQNWVSAIEILRIQEEYKRIKIEIKKIIKRSLEIPQILEKPGEVRPSQIPERFVQIRTQQTLNARQEKILAFLKEQGQAQVWQVKQILPEVTKRTLRRDFKYLLRQGLVERRGERNKIFYQLKVGQSLNRT